MKKILPLILVLTSLFSCAKDGVFVKENIIPTPKEFVLKNDKLYKINKISIFKTSDNLSYPQNKDEYYLKIEKGNVIIEGNEIWAKQTLAQLKDQEGRVPDVEIHDWSAYPFRGFMHDTGRNFQTLEMLKETINLMSLYKINYFHWHLTDNPAWRIECKAYPQLNDPQYQRPGRDCGKFYTYDEIRELIAYAKERGITVMPEIDMPGHSAYFRNAFGFSMDSEEGMKVLEKCIEEFCNEIPVTMCPYLHIGSDEVYIADPKGFMQFTESLCKKHNRIAMAWDPGLPSDSTTVRQIWNTAAGSNAAQTKKGGKYVDSFMGYLNYYDPIYFTNKVFLHKACAQDIPDTTNALGGILCLWNDVRVDDKTRIALHNGMINGMMTFAERFWNGGEGSWEELVAFEEKMSYHKDNLLQNHDVRWNPNAHTLWKITIADSIELEARGGAIDVNDLCTENSIVVGDTVSALAVTDIYSEEDTTIEAWIGFEAAARSNRISGGIGPQGKWENRGRLLVNDVEYFPSQKWNEPEKYKFHYNTWHRPEEEMPYTDEQFYWMREPVIINLKKGNNEIKLYIPKTFKGQRWSFGFVKTTRLKDHETTSGL
ncbi:MAG: family 20 glycosylhydrolase [Bacteroidales bacterium]|nr:family 20 glycosylhydrolase [Bacteroidales bacterium]